MEESRCVIGIDPSLSGTGVSVLDDRGVLIDSDVFKTLPTDGSLLARMNRFEALVKLVKNKCDQHQPEMICIEGYSFMATMPGSLDRIEYGGLLRYVLSRQWEVREVSPMSLKKFASGSGKGDKTGVIAGLVSLYGVRFQSSDEYDSYALARIAMQLKQMEISANTPQKEVIQSLLYPKSKPEKKSKSKRY